MLSNIRRAWLPCVIGAFTLFAAACSDDPAAPEEEPEIETMRITVGEQVVTVSDEGQCTGCPLVLTNGATVAVQFLNSEGEPDPVAMSEEFRLNVQVPANAAGLTFALSSTSSFSGTFSATGTAATPFNVTFQAFHIGEGHADFSQMVAVTVQ